VLLRFCLVSDAVVSSCIFQGAALSLLQNMAMVTGVPPLIRWLQRFRFDPQQPGADMDSLPSHSAASTTASLVLGAGTLF
jgi:hypothetical protein